jgi:zinc protease
VEALTAAEIEACARTLLDPREMLWMVVGDAAQVEPPLRALGAGDIIPVHA